MTVQAHEPNRWVLLDETNGAQCQNGEVLSPEALTRMAAALSMQLAAHFGCDSSARAGADPTDIEVSERVYVFKASLPEAPDAVAYHSVDGAGVPFGMQAITACSSLWGLYGALMAASHEACETEGNPGCNSYAADGKGLLHARERCDACEIQGYPIDIGDGGPEMFVANFLLDSWYDPGAPGPYTYMAANGLTDVDAPGPMQIVPGGGGNYDTVEPDQAAEQQVFGERIVGDKHPLRKRLGAPRDTAKAAHWSSRAYRILQGVEQRARGVRP